MRNDTTAYIIQNEIQNLLLRVQSLPPNEQFQRAQDSLGTALGSVSRGIRILQEQESKAA